MLNVDQKKGAFKYFKQGGRINEKDEFVRFSEMSFEQKKEYYTASLRHLLTDYPNDKKIERFVTIGKLVLLGSFKERVLFTLRQEKNQMIFRSMVCISLLIGFPGKFFTNSIHDKVLIIRTKENTES